MQLVRLAWTRISPHWVRSYLVRSVRPLDGEAQPAAAPVISDHQLRIASFGPVLPQERHVLLDVRRDGPRDPAALPGGHDLAALGAVGD
eukprot:scaffold330227_cov47-Prasinocladus_malaysianus.AAC.1